MMDGLRLDERLDKGLVTENERKAITMGDEAVLEGIWSGRATVERKRAEEMEERLKAARR
jgi:hypothetical protein